MAHTEGRFRVEVSYHAELIATFKAIPSKNYGKCLVTAVMLFFLQQQQQFSVIVKREQWAFGTVTYLFKETEDDDEAAIFVS